MDYLFSGNFKMLPVEKNLFGNTGIGQIPVLTRFRKVHELTCGNDPFF